MEKINIQNFLSIQSAEIEIKKFNILIGPQAQGKSIIAKLISFFKGFPEFLSELTQINDEDLSKEYVDNKYQELFEDIFYKKSWEKQKFSIEYQNDFYTISVTNSDKLNFSYSDDIIQLLERLLLIDRPFVKLPDDIYEQLLQQAQSAEDTFLKEYQNIIDKEGKRTTINAKDFVKEVFGKVLQQSIYKGISFDTINSFLSKNKSNGQLVKDILYIPDKRSLFSELEINSFSLLQINIQFSHYLQKFLRIYQAVQEIYKRQFSSSKFTHDGIDRLVSSILKGRIEFQENKIWIKDDRGIITVHDSSSGQQEVLPMLLVLLFPTFGKNNGENTTKTVYVIEEPEAHLFPTAQKDFVSLLTILFNDFDYISEYMITTHSPYILSYLNNLLYAGNLLKQYPDKRDEIIKIVPENEIISYEDVSVYLINDGSAKSILDEESQLIDASLMDAVSNNIMEEFEQLVSI